MQYIKKYVKNQKLMWNFKDSELTKAYFFYV